MWASIYYDDTSIQRFVSPTYPLKDEKYEPIDLVSLESIYISENGRAVYVRAEAAAALYLLAADFQKQFKTPLVAISGHRSYAYQQRLWDLGRCTPSLCAIPGRSEHQLGLAVDVFEASSVSDFYNNKTLRQYIRWLQENAHKYGYTQSYQYGMAVDGYQVEPWHWRYVDIPLATTLYEKKWTLTQYVQFQNMLEAVRR
jgi:D-alanyl-D-alanine carboxypeptidase